MHTAPVLVEKYDGNLWQWLSYIGLGYYPAGLVYLQRNDKVDQLSACIDCWSGWGWLHTVNTGRSQYNTKVGSQAAHK